MLKRIASTLALCTAILYATPPPAHAGLFDLREPIASSSPDFTGIELWINSRPLDMAALRGKVVLVDFWTYSCINCIHTMPYVKQWYERYRDQGLVVVGVHTPEYGYERLPGNVRDAVKRFGITYPVALDNRYRTWAAFGNHYWPAVYLIDRSGRVVYRHFGEGDYTQTENRIRQLLEQG